MKIKFNLQNIPPVFKNQAGYFLVTFIYSAIPMLILPILTRYLSTAEYGAISLFTFYLSISDSLSGTSLPAFISKNFFSEKNEYIAKAVGNSIFVAFSLSTLLSVILLAFMPQIKGVVSLPPALIVFIPFVSFFFIIYSIGLTIMRNQNNIKSFGFYKIISIITNVSISILLVVVLSKGWFGRAWGIIISYILSFLLILIYLRKQHLLDFTFDSNIFRDIYKMLLKLIPSSLQTILITQVGVFFIEYFYSLELLGLYSVAFKIAFALKLLFTTISFSWGPFLYKQMARNTNKELIAKYFLIIFAVLISGFVFINLFSDLILRILVTESYFGAKEFIPYLSLGFLLNGFYVLFVPIMIHHNKEKLLSVFSFIAVFFLLVFNILFTNYFGYLGVTYAFIVAYLFIFISVFTISHKVLPLPWREAFKNIFISVKKIGL